MKNYPMVVVDFYDAYEDVVAYGTKGHHDFDEVKNLVIDSWWDEDNNLLPTLIEDGHVIHTWYKAVPSRNGTNYLEVKEGVRGAIPYTVWCLK